MAKAKNPVPMIQRPIEEIVRIAHAAGAAVKLPEVIKRAMFDTRFDWINENIPEPVAGIEGSEFDQVINTAAQAFDAGLDSALLSYYKQVQRNIERLKSAEQPPTVDVRLPPSEESHALTLTNAEAAGLAFDVKKLQDIALFEFLDTVPDAYEGQSENDFDEFVSEAKSEFLHGLSRAQALRIYATTHIEAAEPDGKTLISMLKFIGKTLEALARMDTDRQIESEYRQAVAALATAGADLCKDACVFVVTSRAASDDLIAQGPKLASHPEHDHA